MMHRFFFEPIYCNSGEPPKKMRRSLKHSTWIVFGEFWKYIGQTRYQTNIYMSKQQQSHFQKQSWGCIGDSYNMFSEGTTTRISEPHWPGHSKEKEGEEGQGTPGGVHWRQREKNLSGTVGRMPRLLPVTDICGVFSCTIPCVLRVVKRYS